VTGIFAVARVRRVLAGLALATCLVICWGRFCRESVDCGQVGDRADLPGAGDFRAAGRS
jgi:hypothetical protein